MSNAAATATDDANYLALSARDARFDGRFFTGVTSTGIYCRPVCRVRTPKPGNCRFFALAAQAEAAGFRPCMRCRPELAPAVMYSAGSEPWSLQDASAILARQAAQLLDSPQAWGGEAASMATLAQRMGISERHLRRIFQAQWGVSPLQYLQTRRLLAAKHWLTDTQLSVPHVAALSGFSSVRRFNAVFAERYRMAPLALRKAGLQPRTGLTDSPSALPCFVLKAAYRPPYDVGAMLGFFATRAIEGLETIDMTHQTLTRTVSLQVAGRPFSGWVQARFLPARYELELRISESLAGVLPHVLALLKDLLDLDADPQAINPVLVPCFPGSEGARVPGTMDGFELAVRAILGQQITVRAARTLATRMVHRFGSPIQTPFADLTRLFPSAATLSGAQGEELGQLGIVRQRQHAIIALAQAVTQGTIQLSPGADVARTMAALQVLPGIGAWTAHYIAMRALRWPDAFPAGDVALQRALGVQDTKYPAQAAELASQAWKPWRSYAVLRAWASLT